MRKYKIAFIMLTCIAIMLISSCMVASAASLTQKSATFIPNDMALLIKGTVPDAPKIKTITITVYRPGFTPEQVASGTATATAAISNTKEVARDAQGSFEWKYKLNQTLDPQGLYTVYFTLGDMKDSLTIYVADQATVNAALAEINTGGADLAANKEIFDRNKVILNLDTMAYNRIISEAAKDTVIIKLFEEQYEQISDLNDTLVEISVFQLIGNASVNDDIIFLINNYNDTYLKIDLEDYWYKKRVKTEAQKDCIYSYIRSGGPYQSFQQVSDQFQKGVIVEAVNAQEGPGEIKDILFVTRNKDLLGIDFTAYNRLIYKDEVWKKMAQKRNYDSPKAVKDGFNAAVATQASIEADAGTIPGSPGPISSPGGYFPTTNPNTIMPTAGASENTGFTNDDKPAITDIIFSDLGSVPWAKDSIVSLAKAGIVNGKSETTFAPNDNIKREEFIKMLYLGANLVLDQEAEATEFEDAKEDEWYYEYIASAKAKNLINGLSESIFGVGENITRQDMAVIVVRLVSTLGIEMPLVNEKATFSDDGAVRDYAKASVYAMQRAGIINGYDDGTFAPDAFATRAEAAKIIFKLCELIMR